MGRKANGSSIVCLGDTDHGRTVRLHPGELVQVSLAANPSTGFSWQLEELDQQVVRPIAHRMVSDSPMIGANSQLRWLFQAVRRGKTALVLKYYRVWEGPGSAVKILSVRFIVD